MSNEDGPPPMFDGDDFPYWKIRMESYLEACDSKCLKAATEGFTLQQKTSFSLHKNKRTSSGMQRPKTTSLEVFAKRCSTVFRTTKLSMLYGRNFVHSMRDQRVNARNAITL